MTDAIKIDGLSQFVKQVKEIDAALPKMVRVNLNKASDLVISKARPGIPSRSGRAKASMKAASLRDKVRVKAGGNKAPYYAWLDYGGEGRIRGRPAKRQFIKKGRYLYPAYYTLRDSGELLDIITTGLIEVVEAAGIEVN